MQESAILSKLDYAQQVDLYSGRFSRYFVDFVNEQRDTSNIVVGTVFFFFRHWQATELVGSHRRTSQQILEDVFENSCVKRQLERQPQLRAQMESVLNEMSHRFSINSFSARFVYTMAMLMLRFTYQQVYIETRLAYCKLELANSLNMLASTNRIIYLPNHCSYADVLSLYLTTFYYDLPVPTMATGTNLFDMIGVPYLLRGAGGFFIRRNSKDRVYWSTLRAYVHSQLIGGENPMAFYLEGTRSRTGKSYPPKLGLLKLVIELVLRGQIGDITLVPVANSFERVYEEELYACESSSAFPNFKKPPETLLNMINSSISLIRKNYGAMYVRFCQPISVRDTLLSSPQYREFCENHVNDDLSKELEFSPKENLFVADLATRVIRAQIEHSVVSSFSLAAILISSCQHKSLFRNGPLVLPINSLLNDLASLGLLIIDNLSISVTGMSIKEDYLRAVQVHSNLAQLDAKGETISVDMNNPLVASQMQMYANQAMQLLIDHAIYLLVDGNKTKFQAARTLLSFEFLYQQTEWETLYYKAAQTLMASEVRFDRFQPDKVMLTEPATACLRWHALSLLTAYRQVAQTLEQITRQLEGQSFKLYHAQSSIQTKLKLNSDIVQNALNKMKEKNCFVEHCTYNGPPTEYKLDPERTQAYQQHITEILKVPVTTVKQLLSDKR